MTFKTSFQTKELSQLLMMRMARRHSLHSNSAVGDLAEDPGFDESSGGGNKGATEIEAYRMTALSWQQLPGRQSPSFFFPRSFSFSFLFLPVIHPTGLSGAMDVKSGLTPPPGYYQKHTCCLLSSCAQTGFVFPWFSLNVN